jgi:5,10-methylenetetrahydromethanopterin reductase
MWWSASRPAGAQSAGRTPVGLDLGDSLPGAIATDGDFAKEAARILAAFYIPWISPALPERHGITSADVAPVNDAFAAGDVKRALAATSNSIADP